MGLFKSKRFWTSVYAFVFIFSIIWAWKAVFSTSDWLALIGALIFGAVLMFDLFNFITEGDKSKLEHSKDMVREVLEKSVESGIVGYDNDEIFKVYMHWAGDSDWLHYTKKHLEDMGLCQVYIFAKNYDKLKIDEIDIILQQYRKLVELKVENAKIPLVKSKNLNAPQKGEYSPKLINHLIYCDVLKRYKTGATGKKLELFLSGDDIFDLAWCNYNPQFGGEIVEGEVIAKGDRISLEHLKNVIELIQKDSYKTIIDDVIIKIEIMEMQLKNNAALNQFNRERERLVKQVIKIRKPLKGKCSGCPD